MRDCRCWPTQTFAVLPGVSQASASSFPQDLAFELGENWPATRPLLDRPAWSDPAPRSAKRSPLRDVPVPGGSPADPLPTGPSDPDRHTRTTSISRRRAASSTFSRASRLRSAGPTSRTCMATVHPRRAAYSRMARSASEVSADRWWKRGHRGQHGTFSRVSVPGQKRYRILPSESPFGGHFGVSPQPGRSRSFPARQRPSYYAAGACQSRQRLAVVPGHPLRRRRFNSSACRCNSVR